MLKNTNKRSNISAERIGDNAEPCPTPTSASQAPERNEFQEYWVDLPTK